MKRSSTFAFAAALIVAITAWFAMPGSDATPPAGPAAPQPAAAGPTPRAAAGPDAASTAGDRSEVPTAGPDALDPEVRAALCGFRGRVVDRASRAVGDCGVRIYRGALDAILPESVDLFAAAPAYTPRFIAGETRTRSDGTFRIDGIRPRAFYLLFAGIGTDASTHRLLSRAPAPGELVDLGDIVLDDAAVVTGNVVDEDGRPVAGALVRGVDLPAALFALFPIERVDPDGCLLLRAPDAPVRVLEFPAWAKAVFQHLPVPATHSDSAGGFRLTGLAGGNHVVATTHAGLLSDVRPDVLLQAGQVQVLGAITLRRGRPLTGRVVDAGGQPVAGAEVVAGSTSTTQPIDPAQRLGATDADGRFEGRGFAAGQVTVAARRTARDPWVLAEPQPIADAVTVVVPAAFALTLRVTDPAGAIVARPELTILAGKGRDAGTLAVLGAVPAIDLRGRTQGLADGRVRVTDLQAGEYIVMARSGGAATGLAEVTLSADTEVGIALASPVEYRVRVLGPGDRPIANAAIYVLEHRHSREVPFLAGRSGSDGRLQIAPSSCRVLTVSADHPRWGCVNGRISAGDGELVLMMQEPGWIDGRLLDGGKPPPPGKFTVGAQFQPDVRGPIEPVPSLATPRPDGTFALQALQPGHYLAFAIGSLDAMTSPRALLGLAQATFPAGALPVQVASGQGTRCDLEVAPTAAGPTAHLFGTVQIDGRLAAGCQVTLWASGQRRLAEVDGAGRFDCGRVPAADALVTVSEGGGLGTPRRDLWQRRLPLQPDEEKELAIDFATTRIAGVVLRPDGSPAAGVHVQARSRRPDQAPDDRDESFCAEPTDQAGRFAFERAPAGTYRFLVHTGGDDRLRGSLAFVRADAGAPVIDLRIQLQPTIVVAGRVDATAFGGKPDYIGLSFWSVDPEHPEQNVRQVAWEIVQDDGTFSTDELPPGTYGLQLHVQLGGWQQYRAAERIAVPTQGVRGLVVRPVPQ